MKIAVHQILHGAGKPARATPVESIPHASVWGLNSNSQYVETAS